MSVGFSRAIGKRRRSLSAPTYAAAVTASQRTSATTHRPLRDAPGDAERDQRADADGQRRRDPHALRAGDLQEADACRHEQQTQDAEHRLRAALEPFQTDET